MLDTEVFGKILDRFGFRDFCGVPCSYLSPLINYAINSGRFIMANNEGDAIAIASGMSIVDFDAEEQWVIDYAKILESISELDSGGIGKACDDINTQDMSRFPVVLMQNSGLSNALSPLTSLNDTFEIPILGFVSLRGERDENNQNTDEPQHELLGVITDKLLETAGISYVFLSDEISETTLQLIEAHKILCKGKSFFFIVKNKTLKKVDLKSQIEIKNRDSIKLDSADLKNQMVVENGVNIVPHMIASTAIASPATAAPTITPPARLQALEILQKLAESKNAILLATTGKTGRELYEIKDSPNQLYMVGSMGCVGALGLGIALKIPQKVIAIDGDSALLMRLGALSTNAYYAKCDNRANFCHVLLDNQSHDSTGGQFNLSPFVDFASIARDCGYEFVYKAQNLAEFEKILQEFIECKNGGASFIYLKIAKGSKENLGRPKITPKEVAMRLHKYISKINIGYK